MSLRHVSWLVLAAWRQGHDMSACLHSNDRSMYYAMIFSRSVPSSFLLASKPARGGALTCSRSELCLLRWSRLGNGFTWQFYTAGRKSRRSCRWLRLVESKIAAYHAPLPSSVITRLISGVDLLPTLVQVDALVHAPARGLIRAHN